MREAVIVASSRTPLAKSHRGSFNITRPDDLAAHAIRHALGKVPALDPQEVNEVILGCGQPHGPAGHNIARVAALRAGLPVTTAGVTVNRYCNSGLQAIVQAAHMVMHEGVDATIGGGVESITMMERDNSPNPWIVEHVPALYMAMGETAEVVAKRYNVSRESQDEYAVVSQQRTARGQADGFFAGELAPMQVRRAVLDKKTGQIAGEEDACVDPPPLSGKAHGRRVALTHLPARGDVGPDIVKTPFDEDPATQEASGGGEGRRGEASHRHRWPSHQPPTNEESRQGRETERELDEEVEARQAGGEGKGAEARHIVHE
jgi:hypothetical protein